MHQDKVERHEHASSYFDNVASIVWDLRKKFPRAGRETRPVFPRPCPVCDSPSMGVEWQSEQFTDFTLVSAYCGFEGNTGALLKDCDVRYLLREKRTEEAEELTSW